MKPLLLGGIALGCALGASACANVLGIDDAHVDDSLEHKSSQTQGGSGATTGGSDTSGGSAGTGSGAAGTSGSGGQSGSGGGPMGGSSSMGGSVGTGGTSSSTGGNGGTQGKTVCQEYCEDMGAFCIDDYEQYRDEAQCLAVCQLFDAGEIGDSDGNTAACRLKYAGKTRYAAGSELGAYCRQAGPGGDGRCGTNCEGFCTIMMAACTPDNASLFHFATYEDCLTECNALPVDDSVKYNVWDPLVFDGNHVQCRLFHATSALMQDPDEHCEHSMGVVLCEEQE